MLRHVTCGNEVNDDKRNEKEKQFRGRLQARSSGTGYGTRLQDFRSGSVSRHWSNFIRALVSAI